MSAVGRILQSFFSEEGTVRREGKSGGLTFYLFDAFIALYELPFPSFALPSALAPGHEY